MRNLTIIPILLLASSLLLGADDAPKAPPTPTPQPKILPDAIALRWWRSTTEVLRTEQAYKAAIEAQRKALDEATAFCGAQPVPGADNGPACPVVAAKEEKK